MHGIVYVPESEAPSDPLEVEGTYNALRPYSRIAIAESSHVWGHKLWMGRVMSFDQWLADYCVLLLQ